MTITIRPARQDELPLLQEIEQAAALAFRQFPGLEKLAEGPPMALETLQQLFANGICLVAQGPDRRLEGFAAAHVTGLYFHIDEISVRQDQQGRGIGRKLMTALIEATRERGLSCLSLTTYRDVPWNGPWYAAFGFREQAPADCPGFLAEKLKAEAEAGLSPPARIAMVMKLGAESPG